MNPQDPSRLAAVIGSVGSELDQQEDCLVLSVTAPVPATGLPVMAWLHGGAYVSGGGEAEKYDPDDLAREGVVVVNVTYRLGVFGYLAPAVSGHDNLGLWDQIEALRWIKDNITAFGGDPARVTVFGQSAGADSVVALMASAPARGLFHRAIVQSAPLGLRRDREAMTATMGEALAEHLPADPSTASTEQVLAAQRHVVASAQRYGALGGMPFAPMAGREPLPADIGSALAEAATRIDLLIGSTRDDAAPFVAMSPHARRLARWGGCGRGLQRQIARRVTATIFSGPVEHVATLWAGAGGQVATYRFDWSPPGNRLGACHCIELPFLFSGNWADAPMLAGHPVPADLAAQVRRTWTVFARSGVAALGNRTLRFGAEPGVIALRWCAGRSVEVTQRPESHIHRALSRSAAASGPVRAMWAALRERAPLQHVVTRGMSRHQPAGDERCTMWSAITRRRRGSR
jgi:para-nitrobenzyl esterase